jgi:succinoglycan biosynthesis protein ExoA
MKLLTVCIPVLNEGKFIDVFIRSIISIPPYDKEIILIDGGSSDDTIKRIRTWQKKNPNIRVIQNYSKFVSHGFNMAYKESQSIYIALLGAHSEYTPNYFELGLSILKNDEADAVGGTLTQRGKTEKGTIIAACMSSGFGVGNTEFRISGKREYVLTVAMALYKRSVFEKVGLLDEEMIRNQDDEFHYRLNANGFRILMEPAMSATYYVRDDFKSLWKQYFNYGLYKPLVLRKVISGLRLKHLIPSMFVCYLFVLPFLLFVSWLTVLPLLIYILVALVLGLRISRNLKHIIWALAAFSVLHISYGTGMIMGLYKLR